MKRILVTGSSGFIGGHLLNQLQAQGHDVYGLDKHEPRYFIPYADHFIKCDLASDPMFVDLFHSRHFHEVYALAADMGGMGYISHDHGHILQTNLLININTVRAAIEAHVPKILFSSSACVYPEYLQKETDTPGGLKEAEAYPANPQDGYGWEKLTAEKLYEYAHQEHNIEVRIARFHNIYGPQGTWTGGREKVPAALCRKVAIAKYAKSRFIDVWGDGRQVRSFYHVRDCVTALTRLMDCQYNKPVNIGSERAVSINELANMVSEAADYKVGIVHVDGPEGVRWRNSDSKLARAILGKWKETSLEDGLKETYKWIEGQLMRSTISETSQGIPASD